MNKLVTLLVALLVLVAVPERAYAQADVRASAGFVVDSKGDTLRGWLDVPRFVTDYGIRFATTEQGAKQRMGVADVRAFGLNDDRRFVRRTIPWGGGDAGYPDSATIFVQELVAGPASLYRYNHKPASQRLAPNASVQSETQYFARVGSSPLVALRRISYGAALGALLKDCPTVAQEAAQAVYSENALAELLLRYNSTCHAAAFFRDQRLQESRSPLRVHLSVRGGLQSSLLYYTQSAQFERRQAVSGSGTIWGGEARIGQPTSAWSMGLGVMYSTHRSTATYIEPAYLGTTNAGEPLDLSSNVKLQVVQLPIMMYYTLGHGLWQPYAALGVVPGSTQYTELELRYVKLTRVAEPAGSAPIYRQDVYMETTNANQVQLTIGGAARVGMRLALASRLAPLMEVNYGFGYHRHSMVGYGEMPYRTWSVTTGLEF
ncbi:hypothetical protein [Hymenobacter sp. B1770]|uniref:hypothetical protein n=1 Tax=Hymenobacter sp. B1770 TaxID=1718788 RepID=UPI003CFB46CB